jgi:hypothetical protein
LLRLTPRRTKVKKRIALGLVAAALSVGMLPGTASAGQWCERADEVGAGEACRTGLGLVLDVCSAATSKWGNECQLA